MDSILPPRARASLTALCDVIAPDVRPPDELAAAVERRARLLPAAARAALTGALVLLDSVPGALLLGGRGRRFGNVSREARAAWLRRLEHSRLAPRRAAVQALRRIVLYTAWADEDAARRVGWPSHLSVRAPELPWEGPAPGGAVPGEAVLRVPAPAQWRAPPPRPEAVGVESARTLSDGATLRADVCVIGSGAGGSVIACRLAEAGRSVVLLEEGAYASAPDFPAGEGDATDLLYADAGLRTTDDFAISLLQGRCVGGGTTVNWLLALRPRAWAMHEWARAHAADLLGATMFVPELERIERELGAGRVPADAHDAQNRVLLDGCAHLGWKVELPLISASDCVRAGTCGLGCRYNARRGPLSVYLPRALAAGARILADARADRIESGAGHGTLRRVHATVPATGARPDGRLVVEAAHVVVAAGAVGTPALLRRSGLGNAAVGRWLRLHPTTATFARFDRDIAGGTGIPQSVACTEFHDADDGFGFWIECPPTYPGLAAASVPGFGAAHAQLVSDYRRLAAAIVLVRDGRGERSQGSVDVDRQGAPRIRYRLGAHERRRIADGMAAAARIQLAAGARDVRTLHHGGGAATCDAEAATFAGLDIGPHRLTLFSAHVNGTCRMGGDARRHACDPEGRLRGASGIWVADGSLFPTAPGVNPQLSIMALASLVSHRLLAAPAG
ncbi:MAG TPA: GMC family oxidoreductase N-terminal domain-containing protein [Albitalea sp.]